MASKTTETQNPIPADKGMKEKVMFTSQINDACIGNAKIEAFSIDELSPYASRQWRILGDRLASLREYDERHPLLRKFASWPLIGGWYCSKRLMYALRND